ncbi:nitroreductase family protein [Histomonas meleagridis]|uniref:nitroreductase family protein n=1 Tax=Histomonas meleagridis TaxID=135588 RepID=UPI003559588C|nr:nitroreductase family protein [Histomonas meleagridis]KAH0800041.1 nitroreductase family protein [Histomonas meleagridis]
MVEALKTRRSIRNFDPNYELTKEELDTIVECALNSPSALNLQENDLIIIRNKELIQKIDNTVFSKLDNFFQERFLTRQKRYGVTNPVTYDCSALIMIVKNERSKEGYVQLDSGILAMSILTAAQAVGLGSVPIGVLVRPDVEEIIGVEKGSLCLAIAIGKPKKIEVDPKEVLRKVKYID